MNRQIMIVTNSPFAKIRALKIVGPFENCQAAEAWLKDRGYQKKSEWRDGYDRINQDDEYASIQVTSPPS